MAVTLFSEAQETQYSVQEYAMTQLQKNVEFKCKLHDRSYSCNYLYTLTLIIVYRFCHNNYRIRLGDVLDK